MSKVGFSKILNMKYKVIDYHYGKPSSIIFEDNVVYSKRELEIVSQMDDATKVEIHKIKKVFDSMLVELNQVL